ncbi:hypothetical protein [Clostridium tarantellae]|nr:hypothetical protein [Clostridium tarantellae]
MSSTSIIILGLSGVVAIAMAICYIAIKVSNSATKAVVKANEEEKY